jgi:hypothetical protein
MRKIPETLVRRAGLRAEIRNRNLPDMNQRWHSLDRHTNESWPRIIIINLQFLNASEDKLKYQEKGSGAASYHQNFFFNVQHHNVCENCDNGRS